MLIEEQRSVIHSAAEFLAARVKAHFPDEFRPRVLIICGSGLGGISDKISSDDPKPLEIRYDDIPGFKKSTVAGHQGALIFGKMNGSPVVLMNGRLHGYEGHSLFEITLPIRVLHHMGDVKQLIVTNAAGGINPNFEPCDLMCIYDHINLPGFAGLHPLKGANFDETGPRFLPLSDAYDLNLRKLLFKKKQELKIDRPLHEGTYMYVSGPTFETRAESRAIRLLGGDAVGMSTVPEIIVARHCGWKVLALSLITNKCVIDPPPSALEAEQPSMDEGIASHAEVLENGKKASLDVEQLVAAVVSEL
ncbi:hypothetical protein ZYGR_0AS04960 [Zygosaccharomyces rouxii]|uniref:Purine nucleoside phosphorylase n=1 Tax=Zygosaccharomyces rouxii TaxID=4956 RepID=A0A1Q3AHS3_ZYGRO|nr:hypothetical protein ZYGR_0AS04960 [Zygosaccharomyces rouxii]